MHEIGEEHPSINIAERKQNEGKDEECTNQFCEVKGSARNGFTDFHLLALMLAS
jgi:hypothetical protein